MSDVRRMLERVSERVSAAPRGLERVAHRKARRQRNRRISAAALAITVSIAGTAGVVIAFGGSSRPPAGPAGVVSIRLDGPPQPIVADDLAAWTVAGTSDTDNVLWRIDATTNEAVPLENTRGAQWPAVGEGFAWVTLCQGPSADGCGRPAVLKLDPVTGETLATIPLSAYPWQIGVGFGAVWVSTADGLTRIDAGSGEVLGSVPGQFNLLAMAGGSVWAFTGPRAIARIDPSSGEVVGTTSVPDPCVMVAAAGSIWTATCGGTGADESGDVLTRLNAEDGSVIGRTELDHWGHLIGSDEGLWLIHPTDDGRSDVIVPIDVATGEPGGPGYVLPLPDEVRFFVRMFGQWTPFGAASAGSLWITDLGTGTVLRVPLDELGSLQPSPTASSSPSSSPGTEEGRLHESPLGWIAEVPAGWHVLDFSGFGRVSVQGTSFSNVPLGPTEDGMHPDLSELFPDGAALIVSHREGGPAPDYLSDDSTFPLRWEDFRAIPGGLVVGSVQSFRANGSEFTVELAVRADAPESLMQDIRAIFDSIRPIPLTAGETLANGYVVLDAATIPKVGSGSVVEVAGMSFMLIHAPGGYYALGLPDDVPASFEFYFDAHEQQVIWTQEGELFARYSWDGTVVEGPPGARLAALPIHPVVRAWDGQHLLLHPGTQYGPLPSGTWGDS